jgi:hypothetical protein
MVLSVRMQQEHFSQDQTRPASQTYSMLLDQKQYLFMRRLGAFISQQRVQMT